MPAGATPARPTVGQKPSISQPERQMRELGGLPGEAPGGQMSPSPRVLRLLSLPCLGKANNPQWS